MPSRRPPIRHSLTARVRAFHPTDLLPRGAHGGVFARRMVAAAVVAAALAGVVAAVVLLWPGGAADGPTTEQRAALSRLAPYAELLESDLESAVANLPDDLVRKVVVSEDGLSASGFVALPLADGTCAAILVDVGPAYLLDGNPAGVSVSAPTLIDAVSCVG